MARVFRRRIQLPRGTAEGGLTLSGRTVRREILDELEPRDPRAMRSRRDLQRINRVLGSYGILARSLRQALRPRRLTRTPLRLLELGAGDGSLALRLATHFAARWPAAELTLLDRQSLIGASTGTAFAHLGWALRPLTADVLEWARAPAQQLPWDIILTNLFLHHFEESALRELLSSVAMRCEVFIACEPQRGLPALLGVRLLRALGVSRDTRYDALVSVQAGFRGRELSHLWPAGPGGWRLEERPAGLFSHLLVAIRGNRAS